MKFIIFFIWFFIVLSGCQDSSSTYRIKIEGVYSQRGSITNFSISQFNIDHEQLDDIRPHSHIELMRYCCELRTSKNGSKHVLFSPMDTINYDWFLCKLDTSIVSNDSLNNLTFEEKLRYLHSRDRDQNIIRDNNLHLPFTIRKGYVYQIFGLRNLDGSYYFRLGPNNTLIVQFFDRGPW